MKTNAKPTAAKVAEAARAARDALSDILRLESIKTEKRSLTSAQDDDERRSVEAWNNAASIINGAGLVSGDLLSPFSGDGDFYGDALSRRAGMVRSLVDMTEGYAKAEELRAAHPWLDQLADRRSGAASGSSADPIRDMIESRELQHDFDIVRGFHETDSVRAIADFSDSGSLFTTDFSSNVAMFMRTTSPWINLATVINADNGRPLNIPELTADPTAVAPGEGTAISESTPTLGSAALTTTAYKTLSYVSAESFEDAEFNISEYVARSAGRSLALKFGSDATGTVLTGLNNAGTASGVGGTGTATTAFVGYEDLIDLEMSRAAPYRLSAQWVFSNSGIKKVRKFRDGQGNYLWRGDDQGLAPGQPATFEGHAVYEDPYLAVVGSASKSFLFGDFKAALVIKAMPLRVATSADFRFSNDQIAIKVVYRAGIAVQDPAAAAYLVSANS